MEFLSLGSAIQSTSQQLHHIVSHQRRQYPQTRSEYAIISMLLDAACIRLHENSIDQPQSRQLATESARNIARTMGASLIREGEVVDTFIDPIIAVSSSPPANVQCTLEPTLSGIASSNGSPTVPRR